MMCSAVFSSAANILQIHIKCVVSGLRLLAVQLLTVFSDTFILFENAACVILLFLSFSFSHFPNVIESPRMVWARLRSGHQQVYLHFRVWG